MGQRAMRYFATTLYIFIIDCDMSLDKIYQKDVKLMQSFYPFSRKLYI